MNTTTTIPAPLGPLLRLGLLDELGATAALIDRASIEPHAAQNPKRFTRHLQALDAHRALLDEIGWHASTHQQSITVDHTHLWALNTALHTRLHAEQDYLESNPPLSERRGARRNARRITRFLTANSPTPKTPRGRWVRHATRTLTARLTPKRAGRRDRGETPPDTAQLQRTVLTLLIEEYHGRLCSTKQLAKHLPGSEEARHAISELRHAGLVHTIGDHAHASPAAITYHQLHT